MKGHRENGNAHDFHVVRFYITVDGEWNLVPIFAKNMEKEKFVLTISGGADCCDVGEAFKTELKP